MLTFNEIKQAVDKIGKEYGIKNAYLFGSYAKGEANENSDVDLLIERGRIESLLQMAGFENALIDELSGTDVEVITTDGIKPRFYNLIKSDLVPIYG